MPQLALDATHRRQPALQTQLQFDGGQPPLIPLQVDDVAEQIVHDYRGELHVGRSIDLTEAGDRVGEVLDGIAHRGSEVCAFGAAEQIGVRVHEQGEGLQRSPEVVGHPACERRHDGSTIGTDEEFFEDLGRHEGLQGGCTGYGHGSLSRGR